MIVVLLYAVVVLLVASVVLLVVMNRILRKIRALLAQIAYCCRSDVGSADADEPKINLNLFAPKGYHKTRKPTDRAKEWMNNRAKDSREVK